MANRAFVLTVEGANIAANATLQWTVGSTTTPYSLTVSNSGRATANIPVEAVQAAGQTAQVTVTNPGPCAGSCVSNALSFDLTNRLFLPLVTR
jgi:hypothetical protein